jgi:hypothetical protein
MEVGDRISLRLGIESQRDFRDGKNGRRYWVSIQTNEIGLAL